MAIVDYTFPMDEADKVTAEQVLGQFGLSLEEGLNIYIKAVARQKKIPFELSIVEATSDDPRADEGI